MVDDAAFVAVDLGAESGRVMVGGLREDRLELEQVHRFPNVPLRLPDGLHWNVLRLYEEVVDGLRAAAQRYGDRITGVGVDSWAVDYGLLDARGRLLGIPYHYRDSRTDGVRDTVSSLVSREELYARTGIAQMSFNTVYQLTAERRDGSLLESARSLLLIPDLFHFWLTGQVSGEYTNATTTGVLGVDGRWAADVLTRLDLPPHVFAHPTEPGTVLGELLPSVREQTGLLSTRVIVPATHDTACAVVAVPAEHGNGAPTHAYISSGTWSLLGLELDHPILGEDARTAGFTNEGGVAGTYRFLSNIMGLWLLQECRRAWARQGYQWTYDELVSRSAAIPSPGIVIDVDDQAFLHPHDMPAAIAGQLRRTGQSPPAEPAVLVRAILEGLALAYRVALEQAERLAGVSVGAIHVVGGGSRNSVLCQLTADACRRPVLAGPVEATAMGNILVQALGLGLMRDLSDARAVVRRSSEILVYEPRAPEGWDERTDQLHAMRASEHANEGHRPTCMARNRTG